MTGAEQRQRGSEHDGAIEPSRGTTSDTTIAEELRLTLDEDATRRARASR